jgi:hypothetical protein
MLSYFLKVGFLRLLITLLALAVFFLGGTTFAHGVLQSLSKTTDKYLIEVFYDPLDLSINGSTILNFYLRDNNADKQNVAVTDVWLKISQGPIVVFSGPVAQREFGPPSVTYAFPKAGQYEILTRFQNDGETLAEASFPLTVEEFEEKKSDLPIKIIIGASGLVVGTIAGFFIPKPKKK